MDADCEANTYYRVVQCLDAALVPEVDPGSYTKRNYCELHCDIFVVAAVVVVSDDDADVVV